MVSIIRDLLREIIAALPPRKAFEMRGFGIPREHDGVGGVVACSSDVQGTQKLIKTPEEQKAEPPIPLPTEGTSLGADEAAGRFGMGTRGQRGDGVAGGTLANLVAPCLGQCCCTLVNVVAVRAPGQCVFRGPKSLSVMGAAREGGKRVSWLRPKHQAVPVCGARCRCTPG